MPDLEISVTESGSTLTVSVSGEYRPGSSGNQDARQIITAIDSAIHGRQFDSLVIDLSRMNYQWGDAIAIIFHKYRDSNPTFLLAMGCSESWKGLLNMTLPSWSETLEKQIRFV